MEIDRRSGQAEAPSDNLANQRNARKNAVMRWLNDVVIDLDLCPFAKPVVRSDALRALEIEGGLEECLHAVAEECAWLQAHESIETSLLVLGSSFSDFDDYLDLVAMSEALISELGFDGVFQLATFHPDYQFDGTDGDDTQNFTNRSPYPVLHLLRESSVTRVLANYADPASIPERNISTMQRLGNNQMKSLIESCLDG